MDEQSNNRLGPVLPTKRRETLDAVRGVAVFGILLGNILIFSGYIYLPHGHIPAIGQSQIDRVVVFLNHVFIEGKFYSTFALLFGSGLATLRARAAEAGAPYYALFGRRMFGLFMIGLAHALLLWYGDIVTSYAILAFAVLPFAHLSDRMILTIAVVFLFLPIPFYVAMMMQHAGQNPATDVSNFQEMEKYVRDYKDGSYFHILSINASDLRDRYADVIYTGRIPKLIGMFLIGFLAGRRDEFARITKNPKLYSMIALASLPIGILFNVAMAGLERSNVYSPPSPLGLLQTVCTVVGVPVLCLGYVLTLLLLQNRPRWYSFFKPLSPVGRMALTNYVMQSVVCTSIFYGYGLRLFGQVGPALGMVLAAFIFLAQVAVSNLWQRVLDFGPLEIILRDITYAQWVRISPANSSRSVS